MPQSTKDSAGGTAHSTRETGVKAKAPANSSKPTDGRTGPMKHGEEKTTK
jgi:hypothetical protein